MVYENPTLYFKSQVLFLESGRLFLKRWFFIGWFKIEGLDVGRVYKIRIGHDCSGIGAGWFLEKVDVKRLVMAMVKPEKKEEEKKDKKKKKKKKVR